MKPYRLPCLVLSAAFALPAVAHGPAAHVHGIAKLDVAVEGDTLTLGLESPLDNLLGFEHVPSTDKQKAAVRAMADTLNKPGTLFMTTPAAQCTPASTKLESPVLESAKKGAGDGHADLEGEFVFHCAHPKALRDIEVKLFGVFPHLRQIDVQIVGPRNQMAASLTPKQPRMSW